MNDSQLQPEQAAVLAHQMLDSIAYSRDSKLAFIGSFVTLMTMPAIEQQPSIQTKQERATKPVRSIKTPEAKPRSTNGKMMCRENTVSECVCGASYIANKDVVEGMKGEAFAACFTPRGDAPALETPLQIRYVDKCMMTNCPACRGEMTLVLWGKKPEKDFDGGQVESVGSM